MTIDQQIKEMTSILDRVCDDAPHFICRLRNCSECGAIQLYRAGYRKQKQSKWISVEDRLPERDGRYLVYDVGLPRRVSTAEIRTIHFKKGDRYHEYMWRSRFTHWMSLPEPPKMKGGE